MRYLILVDDEVNLQASQVWRVTELTVLWRSFMGHVLARIEKEGSYRRSVQELKRAADGQ